MATTYEPIQSYTLGSSQTTITFSSIPSTYTDLIIVSSITATNGAYPLIRVNSDSGTNYSRTVFYGATSGSGTSFKIANETSWYGDAGSGSTPRTTISQFQNYSNSSTYKNMLQRWGTAGVNVAAGVYLWRNTAAITRIDYISSSGAADFSAGSTFTLYGIKAA